MSDQTPTLALPRAALEAEIAGLRRRLEDAEQALRAMTSGRADALGQPDAADEADETVRAIRRGEVDAFVVATRDDEPSVRLLDAAVRRYQLIVEQMHDGALTVSPHGDIVYANAAFAAMLGAETSDLLGRHVTELVPPSQAALLDAATHGRGDTPAIEVAVRQQSGTSVPMLLRPIRDEHGTTFVATDLSLSHRLAEAEEALRAISRGEVDAFVVAREQDSGIELLGGAHRPYRLLVERMQQGAVTLTATGDVLYTNQPFASMLGQPIEALLGNPLADFVDPADRPLLSALTNARRGGATQGELSLLHADGTHVPVLVTTALLPDEGGVCLIVTDLTAQKAYEAVVAAQTLERSILDQAVDGIVMCDPSGRVTRASRAAFELCMCNPLLRPFRECFMLDSESGPPALDDVLRGQKTLRGVEYTLRRAGSTDATVLLSAAAVVDGEGNVGGCVVTLTEITERRLNEDRLREEDRRKDEFLAILAHELRNPLAPIRSAVEILRVSAPPTNPHAAYAVDIIARQSANLVRLVDDLLDINRINQGKIALQMGALDMRNIVAEAAESAQPMFVSRGQQFTFTMPDAPVPVSGDAVRLTQVIANLLGNAAKFTPRGGAVSLTLEKATDGGEAVVTVADNGAGIPADMLARIFEPYQQASHSKGRATGGLGLGLTVSRRLMEMHGGSVEAASDGVGRGSRFVVRLPLAATTVQAAAAPPVATGAAKHLDVVVIDDNRDAAESLAYVLESSGHRVRALSNGADAIAAVAQTLPNAVLLDIGMPGMDGYEVARRLRQLPGGRDLLLIAMTGYGSDADRLRSRENRIDHHLVKPVDLSELQQILNASSAGPPSH